ncbi:MAG TPA: glycosyltransferase family 2 protein [Patescibacteria group bacterium]|nr:glycosyltransferase family 2 protein [Patescibacteria group bacterium]
MKKIFIIILNFNGWENTTSCLDSIEKVELDPSYKLEIVVVDNASVDGSISHLEKRKGITLIKNKENLGFSGGCNVGVKYGIEHEADFLVMLNNDTRVDHHFLNGLIKAFDDEKVGASVPKIYFEKGYEYHKEKYKKSELGHIIWYAGGVMDWDNLVGKNRGVDEVDHGQFDEESRTDLATGCCLAVKVEVFKKIGFFDERYFLYYEDADLTKRIKAGGYDIFYEPSSIVWHKNAASSGSGSNLHDYYICRNRLLFGITYASIRTKIALLRESIKLFFSGRKWQRRGVLDFYIGRFGRGSFKITQ